MFLIHLLNVSGLALAALHSKAVDYVKSGQPAQMPKNLRPRKWPHFMEKNHKPKEAVYVSQKILGQLYDKVERVDFVPRYDQPFDRRILQAYKLDSAMLNVARQLKSEYDSALRRIMAQHEIKTEFEIWTTFVLSKPRVGSDYKLQEEMAIVSDGLKERFRSQCVDKAGSKDFESLGPFVAAMYKVTSEEMEIALHECKQRQMIGGRLVPVRGMDAKFMPLISFPWLFPHVLGKIATGIDAREDLELPSLTIPTTSAESNLTSRKAKDVVAVGPSESEGIIKTAEGTIIHRGEVLEFSRPDGLETDSDADSPSPRSISDSGEERLLIGQEAEANVCEVEEGSMQYEEEMVVDEMTNNPLARLLELTTE